MIIFPHKEWQGPRIRPLIVLLALIPVVAACSGAGGWSIRKGDNFAWASGSAAWGIDAGRVSCVTWKLSRIPEGRYQLFVGGYKPGRTVYVSTSDMRFTPAFTGGANTHPSPVSGGVEFKLGAVEVGAQGLQLTVAHRRTPGVSYIDYFRLVPVDDDGEEGDAIVVEAESITPQPADLAQQKIKPPSDRAVREAVAKVHELLWKRFVDPQTDLLYTQVPAGGVTENNRGSVEDSSLCGGMYLDAMILRYRATGAGADAEKARRIYKGLLRNAKVAGEPGYIVRGFHPGGDDWRGEPSVDQYTGLLFGMWRYYNSRIPKASERGAIRRLFQQVLARLQRHNWQIRKPDGEVTQFGHLDKKVPTRAERLLSFLLMGHDVTGDDRWKSEYEKLVGGRLSACTGFTENTVSWVALQSKLSFRALLDLEPNWSRRKVYRQGMCECARAAWRQVPEGVPALANREKLSKSLASHKTAYSLLRVPLDGISTVLLSDNLPLAKQATERLKMLATFYDYSHCLDSRAIAPVEWNYWLGVQRGCVNGPGPR